MSYTYMPEGYSREKFKGYSITALQQAKVNGEILEAPVIKATKDLALIVNLGINITGTIEFDDFENNILCKPTKSIAVLSRVGKMTQFKVKEITGSNSTGYEIKLSRKDAQIDCYNNFITKLQPGQVISAMATYVENYGIFCDIGAGITSLLPIELFCVTRILEPKKFLKGLNRLKVIVKDITDSRVTVSHKELLGTWEQETAKFTAGETVLGTVRSIEDYGIFVELTPNLMGLAEKYPDVEPGDTVKVYIKCIYQAKMKVKLVIIGKSDPNVFDQFGIHFDYRLPEDGFVHDWVYSPEDSNKNIETHF